MKHLFFIVGFFMTGHALAQDPVLLVEIEVETGYSDVKMNGVVVDIYNGNEVFVTDTTNESGKVKIEIPIDKQYRIEIKKNGFVTKVAELDGQFEYYKPELFKAPSLPIFFEVGLNKECKISDYSSVEGKPLIKFYLDSLGQQTWDKQYTIKMLEQFEDAELAGLSKEERSTFLENQRRFKKLVDRRNYEEALSVAQKMKEIVPCENEQKRIEFIENKIEIKKEYDRWIEEADINYSKEFYRKAIDLYNKALELIPNEQYPKEKINDCEYKLAIQKADKFYKRKEYYEALKHYKIAKRFNPKEAYPQNQIDKLQAIIGPY